MNPTPNQHPRVGWLLVTNKGDCTLSIVDPTTNREIAAIQQVAVNALVGSSFEKAWSWDANAVLSFPQSSLRTRR
jgi:YVTN family beta-propeller protein